MNLTTRFFITFSFLSLLGLVLIVSVIFSTWQEEHINDDLVHLRKAVQLTVNEAREDLVDFKNYSLYLQNRDSSTLALKRVVKVPEKLLNIPYIPGYEQGSTEIEDKLYLWVAVPGKEQTERYLAFYLEEDLSITDFYKIYGASILVIALICLWAAIWTALILSRTYKKIEQQKLKLEHQYEDLVDARMRAEEANIAKSAFLANMSHELRTPLNAIIGYCEMLQEDAVDKVFDNVEQDLDKVHKAANHLLTLINGILDLSKIEAGKMVVNIEPVNINALIDEIIAIIQPMANKSGNKLAVFHNKSHPNINTDPIKLRQIIFNLLSNASKFCEKGLITLSVNYYSTEGKQYHEIIVKDEGIGMSEEQIAQIFNPFVQADSSITRSFGGTGLGLSISGRFVEMLGGTISVKSKPGEGSVFTVLLPEHAHVASDVQEEQLSA